MMKMIPVRYLGGPLDGTQAQRRSGKLSAYRRDDGRTLPAGHGDRIFASPSGQRKRHGYVLVEHSPGDLVYRHASLD
jgi:hypothetical protein